MTKVEFDALPLMLTVSEMCKVLRIGRNKGYELIKSGTVFYIKYGNSIRIPRTAIEKIVFSK